VVAAQVIDVVVEVTSVMRVIELVVHLALVM
jgi:hypothetical protein